MPREAFLAARPHLIRAAVLAVIFIAAIVVADLYGQIRPVRVGLELDRASGFERTVAVGAALVGLIAGALAVRAAGSGIKAASATVGGAARGSSLAFAASFAGYLVVLLAIMGAVGVPLRGIFVGGALTGIVLGIAAQQTIGNFFAGVVILVARPFTVGEDVVLKSGPLGGLYSGRVTDMTLLYVHLNTEEGPVALPNAIVLASAIGPGAHTST